MGSSAESLQPFSELPPPLDIRWLCQSVAVAPRAAVGQLGLHWDFTGTKAGWYLANWGCIMDTLGPHWGCIMGSLGPL